jgi:hypothetical protein
LRYFPALRRLQSLHNIWQFSFAVLLPSFHRAVSQKDESFGNARLVRNVYEKMKTNLSERLASVQQPAKELLTTFEFCDVPLDEFPVSQQVEKNVFRRLREAFFPAENTGHETQNSD